MINRLGWKADVSEDNSDCSVDSLTDADEAELDDFFSFLSMEDVTTGDSLSNVESDCFSDDCASSDYSDDNSIVAPPFSPIPSTENEHNLDAENPEGSQLQRFWDHAVMMVCLQVVEYGMDSSWSVTILIRIIINLLLIEWIKRPVLSIIFIIMQSVIVLIYLPAQRLHPLLQLMWRNL